MFLNAYALFFLCALVGSVALLCTSLRTSFDEVLAVLSGARPQLPATPARPRYARIRSGRRRAFPPVAFSICRI